MNIIIDTHIFLWLAADLKKVNSKHLEYIKNTDNNIYLSSLSIAEIMIKKSIGNLEFDGDIVMILDEMGIDVLDFDASSALLLGTLPFHHRDPFDRIIISQAISKKYKIISVDGKFKLYDCELLNIGGSEVNC
ncbi:MAG: type II toxin-antitoxin system VapC family toxin [Campylobacterota bacterium]|nr:type II toxin-antitoxin system VapC family toxin [Campylobacterota bacterium]